MITIELIRKRLIENIETSGIKKADICRELGITSATMAQYKSGRKISLKCRLVKTKEKKFLYNISNSESHITTEDI